MASLTGGAVVRRDLLLPPPPQSPSSLYGPPVGSRPPEHRGAAADDEFKMKLFTSAPNGFTSSTAVAHTAVGCHSTAAASGAPMMKTCFWCGYSSIRVSDLMTHMKSAHPQEYSANEAEAPAPSPAAGGAASSSQCLGSASSPASESAAAGALQPATTASDDGASARRYKCFSCEARFCRSGTLVDHMRRNHPEVCQPPPSEMLASATGPAATARRPSLGPAWPPPFSAAGERGERGSPAAENGTVGCGPAAAAMSSSPSTSLMSSVSQSFHSTSMSVSRKRPAAVHQQQSESSTADDDDDDDDLDIKVIRLVSQRGSGADGGGLLLRSAAAAGESAALLGRLRASGWPAAAAGHFFRGGGGAGAAAAAALASVEQKDIGSLLGALRAAGAVDMSGRGQYGSGRRSSPDSAVISGSGGCADGSAAGMLQGDAAGPCQAPATTGAGSSIHLVRVSGVTAGLVGIGGGAGAKVGGSSSSSSSLDGGANSNGGPSGSGGGGLRAPEKYKCFWCDAHFRKRGKLMDHIDLFHKDSKQQTEVQAELLTSSGGAAAVSATAADLRQQQQRPSTGSVETPSTVSGRRPSITGGGLLPAGGCKLSSPTAHGAASAGAASGVGSTAFAAASSTSAARPAVPPTCRFVLRAATRVECEPTPATASGAEPRCGTAGSQQPRTCKFYFGKLANPLTVPCGWPFGSHLMVRAGGNGLPCAPGTPAAAAAAAAAMNFGLTVGPPPAAVAAYGAPYAVYCANGGGGGGVRFYAPHSFLSKRSDAVCGGGAPFAPVVCPPSAYGRAAAPFVGGQTAAAALQQQQQLGGSGCPERLLLPVHEAAAAAVAAAASLLHRGPPPKADAYAGGAGDAPLDLSSRGVRL